MELNTIRIENLSLSSEQLAALMPYFWVFVGGLLTLILSVLRSFNPKWPVIIVTLATVVMGTCSALQLLDEPEVRLFSGMMDADAFSHFFTIVFLACTGLTALLSIRYLDRESLQYPEYYVLMLFSTLGMMLMTSATHFIVLFIALEIMSLPVYILVGFRRADRRSNEAALKYFVLGSAASAIFLYGAALLYGATGTLYLPEIVAAITARPDTLTSLFGVGALFAIVGFLFKVAAIPFHAWMPDVYEGAPTPVTGFMTTALKAAAFAAFLRILVSTGYGSVLTEALQSNIHHILWGSAVLTMVVGNVVALTQTNLKRMLAYSSIAHTGYLLVGMIAGPAQEYGYGPVVMYLVAYAVMNLGAFGILTAIAGRQDQGLNLPDLAGLAKRNPWLAFAMSIFLFSMAGVPPTAGFAAKYYLFYGAVQAGETLLVVISVLCSAISVFYYLRVMVYMYMKDASTEAPTHRVPLWAALAIAVAALVTVEVGVLPGMLVEITKKVAATM